MAGRIERFFQRFWHRHSLKIVVVSLIGLFFVVYLWRNIFISIYPGERGVLWQRFKDGTVIEKTYPEGFHTIFPWDKMYVYNVRIQEIRDSIQVLSSNGLVLDVNWSARFRPQADSIQVLHKFVGPNYIEDVIRPEVISAIRRVLGNYTPEQIYVKDEEGLLDEIANTLQRHEHEKYVDFDDILLKRLMLPVEIQTAIKDKLKQEQLYLSYEFRLKAEEGEKKRRQIEAEGIKQFEELSGIPILKWRGIQATEVLAQSPNSKIVIIGTDSKGLPIILNTDTGR